MQRKEKGLVLQYLEGDRMLLETQVWGNPGYTVGDEITVLLGYRRGLNPSKMPTTRFRVVDLHHVVRRVEQPHEAMYHEVVLQVVVQREP